MMEKVFRRSQDLWLPLLVVAIGWMLSLAGWGLLIQDRRQEIARSTYDMADATRDAIDVQVRAELVGLEGLAEIWARFGQRPLAEWKAEAALLVERFPGLTTLSWIDLETRDDRRVIGEAGADDALAVDFEQAKQHGGEAVLSGPTFEPDGTASFRIMLPTRPIDGHDGMLVARIRIEEFLSTTLQARARDHALEIVWGNEVIYRRDEPADDPALAWWHAERELDLPLPNTLGNGSWRIIHRPTQALADARLRATPHFLLAASLFVSVLLAAVVHQLRRSTRLTRFLEATNVALEESRDELHALNRSLKRRVRRRTRDLRLAVKELEAFNYSVSHDLRSPLGAVMNFAVILREDFGGRELDAEGQAIVDRIERSASRANDLLEGLLHLSRAGRAALEVEAVDMQALAAELFREAIASEGGAAQDVEFEAVGLPTVQADRALISAVLVNLFGNALKYSRGRETRRVEMTSWRDGDFDCFEVRDTGRGFEMRFAEKLFGVFERLHAEQDIEGMGVGLALVARVIERHGGEVWARGELGKGARFGFSLPVDPEADPDHTTDETTDSNVEMSRE